MQRKQQLKRECFKAYVEVVLSEHEATRLHRVRPHDAWTRGDRLWYWRLAASGKSTKRGVRKKGMFRGPACVLLQEREHKDGTMQNTSTVWLVDGDRPLRC